MEKQRVKSEYRSFRRLLNKRLVLAGILFCSGFLLSAQFKLAMLKELKISPVAEQQLYAGSEIKFEVNIPYLKPSEIELTVPDYEDNITFKTLRKTESKMVIQKETKSEFYDFMLDSTQAGGTKIELWYIFEKAGEYQPSALQVKVKNSKQKIAFEKITVKNDPKEMSPVAVVLFENGVKLTSKMTSPSEPVLTTVSGKPLRFRIFVQYGMQLMVFNWDLPKDSIFTRTKEYDFTEVKYRDKKYSDELIPVSDFEWTPLVEGVMSFPDFDFTVTGYEGNKVSIRLPEFQINVKKGNGSGNKGESSIFDSAFDFSDSEPEEKSSVIVSRELCQVLAQLRAKERMSIGNAVLRKRAELEQSLGISSDQKEFKIIILGVSIILLLVVCGFFIIFIRKKKLIAAFFVALLLIFDFGLVLYSAVRSKRTYGVSCGFTVKVIPEAEADGVAEIGGGNRVRITETAGNWLYVEFGAIQGWTQSENVILIGDKNYGYE